MSQYLIQLPAGTGDQVTQIDTSGNRWLQPFEDLIIDGQDGAFQVVTNQVPEADDVNERPFSPGGLDENNGQSYVGTRTFTRGDRFRDAAKGDTTLFFLEDGAAANAARWRPEAWARVSSDDSEGPNAAGQMPYPNAPCNLQYVRVKSVNVAQNSVTLYQPLRDAHTNDKRDYATDWGGTGQPRITSLNRTPADGDQGFTAKEYLEIRRFTFRRPTNNGIGYLITPAIEFVLDGCDVGIYIQPSQSDKVTWRNFILRLGGEMDKELNQGFFSHGKVYGPLTNGRWRYLRVEDVQFYANYSPAGTVQEYFACTFTAGVLVENGQNITAYGSIHSQPGHKPVDKFTLHAGQTFTTASGNTAPGHVDYAPHDLYTVEVTDSSNDLLLPGALTPGSVPKGQDFYRQTCVGMAISNVSGTKKGRFTRRFWDEVTQRWHYQHTAPKFAVGEKLVYSHVRNLIDEGGHTIDDKRLFPDHSRRFQNNIGTGGNYNFRWSQRDLNASPYSGQNPSTAVPFFGTLTQLSINITKVGTGTLMLSNYPMVTDVSGASNKNILTVSTATLGARTLTVSGLAGQQSGDTFDLSALGWLEAMNCDHNGTAEFTITGLWSNTEAPLT